MKKIVAIAAVLAAAAMVQAEDLYQYDTDFDGVDDPFDDCSDRYAYTLNGCPGGPPDNREQTCEHPLKVKPGLYVRDDTLFIPLNRKFCWGDQDKLLMLEQDGVLYLTTGRQRVPREEEIWSTAFTVEDHGVRVRAEGAKAGTVIVHQMAITGFQHPMMSWDFSKARLVVAEKTRQLPYAKQTGEHQWESAVSEAAMGEFLAPQRHRFDVTRVEVLDSDDGAQVGVRVTTTLTELLFPADVRTGAPDITVKLGHYFLYWRPAEWIVSVRTRRDAMEDAYRGGKLELTFLRAVCTASNVDWKSQGRGVFMPEGVLIENIPARSDQLTEDRCAVVLDVCATGDTAVEAGDGMLTVWVSTKNKVDDCARARLRRQSRPHL